MIEFMIIFWFLSILFFAFIEFLTVDFVSIWFSGGSIVALIIAIFWPDQVIIQFFVFIGVSAVLLVATRPVVVKYFKRNEIKTNVDGIVGKIGVVTREISDMQFGEVRVEGKFWTAMSDESIPSNTHIVVLAIDGVKLVVKKQVDE